MKQVSDWVSKETLSLSYKPGLKGQFTGTIKKWTKNNFLYFLRYSLIDWGFGKSAFRVNAAIQGKEDAVWGLVMIYVFLTICASLQSALGFATE